MNTTQAAAVMDIAADKVNKAWIFILATICFVSLDLIILSMMLCTCCTDCLTKIAASICCCFKAPEEYGVVYEEGGGGGN